MRPSILVIALLVVACGAGEPDLAGGTNAPPASSTSTPGASTTSLTGTTFRDGVRVRITGFLVADDGGFAEICPFDSDCPGILVEGAGDAAPGTFVELIGVYDGRSIGVEEWLAIASPSESPDFANPCGIANSGNGNPPDDLTDALNRIAATQEDRFAGMWWDSANQVMTAWFTGDDVTSIEQDIRAAVDDGTAVCVAAGAKYSEQELREMQSRLFDVVDAERLAVSSTSTDVVRNRVEVSSELLDAPTRAALNEAFGDAVSVRAFIEVLDGPVDLLPDPIPAVSGDLILRTQSNRAGGGMSALGRFELRYDPDLRCLYFPGDEDGNNGEPGAGGRTLPVWPFGYTATSDPVVVYDFDGAVVAREGDLIESGGGFVAFLDGEQDCGATGAWIMSGPPTVVEP